MAKLKFIIIIIVLIIAGFFAYSYFFVSKSDSTTGLKDVAKTDTVSTSDITKTAASASKEMTQNEQYVKQLITLRAISFNLDLFNDDAYKVLHDANTVIPDEEKGRHNPFAPLEAGDGAYTPEATSTAPRGFQLTSTSTRPNSPAPSTTRSQNAR